MTDKKLKFHRPMQKAFGGRYGKGHHLAVSLSGHGGLLTGQIVDNAHKRCSFSNATKGNADIALNLF